MQPLENDNFICLKCNNIKTLALFDSRAAKSCVSQRFVNCLKLKIQNLPIGHSQCFAAAKGKPLFVAGLVPLTLNIQGLCIPHSFAVLKHLT